ncbi:MAG TPA: hypothetical protein VF701_01990 [Thermoanaerobaculia bacterium]
MSGTSARAPGPAATAACASRYSSVIRVRARRERRRTPDPRLRDGGSEPLWANSGREIFYRNGDTIIAAQITTEPALAAGALVPLFDFPLTFRDISRGWDITPDDQHFIMIERSAGAESMRTLNVVRSASVSR